MDLDEYNEGINQSINQSINKQSTTTPQVEASFDFFIPDYK